MIADAEIERNLDLVDKIMSHTRRQWRYLDEGEVRGAAFEAMMNAAHTYSAAKNKTFRNWAFSKIRWAIIDYVRSQVQRIKRQNADGLKPFPGAKPLKVKPRRLSEEIPMEKVCLCGHPRWSHMTGGTFSCQHFDSRRHYPYCGCDCFELPAPRG